MRPATGTAAGHCDPRDASSFAKVLAPGSQNRLRTVKITYLSTCKADVAFLSSGVARQICASQTLVRLDLRFLDPEYGLVEQETAHLASIMNEKDALADMDKAGVTLAVNSATMPAG